VVWWINILFASAQLATVEYSSSCDFFSSLYKGRLNCLLLTGAVVLAFFLKRYSSCSILGGLLSSYSAYRN